MKFKCPNRWPIIIFAVAGNAAGFSRNWYRGEMEEDIENTGQTTASLKRVEKRRFQNDPRPNKIILHFLFRLILLCCSSFRYVRRRINNLQKGATLLYNLLLELLKFARIQLETISFPFRYRFPSLKEEVSNHFSIIMLAAFSNHNLYI